MAVENYPALSDKKPPLGMTTGVAHHHNLFNKIKVRPWSYCSYPLQRPCYHFYINARIFV